MRLSSGDRSIPVLLHERIELAASSRWSLVVCGPPDLEQHNAVAQRPAPRFPLIELNVVIAYFQTKILLTRVGCHTDQIQVGNQFHNAVPQ